MGASGLGSSPNLANAEVFNVIINVYFIVIDYIRYSGYGGQVFIKRNIVDEQDRAFGYFL